eukprot:m51a1_g8516 putative gtpase-activator protein for ras family gtpase (1931) ;mRNA; r:92824-99197
MTRRRCCAASGAASASAAAAAPLLLVGLLLAASARADTCTNCCNPRIQPLYPPENAAVEMGAAVTFRWQVYTETPCQSSTDLTLPDGTHVDVKMAFNVSAVVAYSAAVGRVGPGAWKLCVTDPHLCYRVGSSDAIALCARGGLVPGTLVPPDHAPAAPPRPLLRWTPPVAWGAACVAAETRAYSVWVSDDATGAPRYRGTTAATQLRLAEDLAPGPHRWRVVALNSGVLAAAYPEGVFGVCANASAPAAPVLDALGVQATATPTLSWVHAGGWGRQCNGSLGGAYDVYLAQDLNPLQLLATTQETRLAVNQSAKLVNGLFRWRVVARNAFGLEASSAGLGTFSVRATSAPPEVSALRPGALVEYDGTAAPVRVAFAWAGPSWGSRLGRGPLSYTLAVAGGPNATLGTAQLYAAALVPRAGAQVAWSVRADNGESASVAGFAFAWCDASAAPAAPLLLAPAGGAVVGSGAAALAWRPPATMGGECAASAVPFYDVLLAAAEGGAEVRARVAAGLAAWTAPALAPGRWTAAVAVHNRRGATARSPAVAFSVCDSAVPAPVPLGPADMAGVASSDGGAVVVSWAAAVPREACADAGNAVAVQYGTSRALNATRDCGAFAGNGSCAVQLPAPGLYYWRVVVSGKYGSAVSVVRTLLYGSPCPASLEKSEAAQLVSPADGASVRAAAGAVRLAWSPRTFVGVGERCTGSRHYTVYVSRYSNFSVPAVPPLLVSDAAEVAVAGLAEGAVYHWRVLPTPAPPSSSLPVAAASFYVCPAGARSSASALGPAGTTAPPAELRWSPVQWACGPGSVEVWAGAQGSEELYDVLDGAATSLALAPEYVRRLQASAPSASLAWHLVLRSAGGLLEGRVDGAPFSVCDPGELPTPTLLGPVDGTTVSLDDAVRWNASAYANPCGPTQPLTYVVSAYPPGSDAPVAVGVADTSYALRHVDRPVSGVWRWTVQTASGGRLSEPATPWSFYICVPADPAEPLLASPGAGRSATSPVAFAWASTSFGEDCNASGSFAGLGYTLTVEPEPGNAAPRVVLPLRPWETSAAVALAPGAYTWSVSKTNAVKTVPSAPRALRVCAAGAPAGLRLLWPRGNVTAVDVALRWSLESWGDECDAAWPAEAPQQREFRVFLTPVGAGAGAQPQLVATLNATAASWAPEALVGGAYAWSVEAWNGRAGTAAPAEAFGLCVPTRPPYPYMLHPNEALVDQPRLQTFMTAPAGWWGETCERPNTGSYQLNTRSSEAPDGTGGGGAGPVWNVSEARANTTAGGLVSMTAVLGFGSWRWWLTAQNSQGLVSADPQRLERTIKICENHPPTAPTLLLPADGNSSQSTYSIVFRWRRLEDSDFGTVCDGSIKTVQLWFGRSAENMTTLHNLPEMADTYEHAPAQELDRGSDYYWAVVAINGRLSARSGVWRLRTVERDCRDVPCAESRGICNRATLRCDCEKGYSGRLCEKNDSKDRNVRTIVIAVCCAGGALLLVVGVAVGLVVVLCRNARRLITLEAPNFDELRWVPVKRPAFPPDVDAAFEPRAVEAALVGPDGLDFVWMLCKCTAITESDALCKALVYAYQRHGGERALALVQMLISREIAEAEAADDPSVLFRANSLATKAFKFYSKMVGLPYLFQTVAVLLQTILRDLADAQEEQRLRESTAAAQGREKETSSVKLFTQQIELDPEKAEADSDENVNVYSLQLMCQKFLVQITRSDRNCPRELRRVCAHLRSEIGRRFPAYVARGVGAFMFLRFYNTAITVPESYGLMPQPPTAAARRTLILISKVLQNLANGVKFGDKERFMAKLNTFMGMNQQPVARFLDRLCDAPPASAAPLQEIAVPDELYTASLATVYNQLLTLYRTDPGVLERVVAPRELQLNVVQACSGVCRKDEASADADDLEQRLIPVGASASVSSGPGQLLQLPMQHFDVEPPLPSVL